MDSISHDGSVERVGSSSVQNPTSQMKAVYVLPMNTPISPTNPSPQPEQVNESMIEPVSEPLVNYARDYDDVDDIIEMPKNAESKLEDDQNVENKESPPVELDETKKKFSDIVKNVNSIIHRGRSLRTFCWH